MIPIGGIQMVHSVPTSATTPLGQQGAPPAAERGRRGGERLEGGGVRDEVGGVRLEQEESIHTCTKAIASLCLDPQCVEGGRAASASSVSCPDSHQQQRCSSPHPPAIQHFSGLELRPSSSSSPAPLPPSPAPDSRAATDEKKAEKKDAS